MTADLSGQDGQVPLDYQQKVLSRQSAILHRIADRNPFYLISAACMLGGCLALTNSLSWWSLSLERLLLLIGTLDLYEGGLIGLALLLLGRGLLRDGKILLIVEAFFLFDVTFLNAEVVTANLHVGIVVNAILLILAAIKLYLIMRGLKATLSTATFSYAIVVMAALLAIPCVLRGIDHGSISPFSFYVIWWIVGLMPMVREVAIALWGQGTISKPSGPAALYLGLPWVSLIAHVGILHYVYDVPFYGAMAAPLLLGFTIVLNRAVANRFVRKQDVPVLKLLLPLAAVMVSISSPHELAISLGQHFSPINTITPALAGAYLTYVYCFLWPVAGWFLAGGALAVLAMVLGPTTEQARSAVWSVWSWGVDFTDWIVPKTLAGWGMVSVLASFFFLILGAAISLARPRAVMEMESDVERK
jgi:hypothetical protein